MTEEDEHGAGVEAEEMVTEGRAEASVSEAREGGGGGEKIFGSGSV